MEHSSDHLNGIFQALADPTRRAVLRQLGRGPASIGALAQPFAMALPSFMKHIHFLEDKGLIRTQKNGRVRTCTLEKRGLPSWTTGSASSAPCGKREPTGWSNS